MSKVFSPKESGKFIVEKAKDVFIADDGVKKCAAQVRAKFANHRSFVSFC
jgi:hypothetical protein